MYNLDFAVGDRVRYNGHTMNLNKAMVIGRITQDLELKTTNTGREVVSFSVASNRTWKDQSGQKQEKTEFHNIVSWGSQAKTIAQYFVKGQEIYAEGRLETRNWEDEGSGKKMYRTEIVLEKFEFGSKPGGAGGGGYSGGGSAAPAAKAPAGVPEIQYPTEEINPDDIPF